ncbi:MAG: hypothetical protein R3250_00290 [Melioribacteraceae bacterium]|nr:hypothetical protein [Melioribacteraceae bacterium]
MSYFKRDLRKEEELGKHLDLIYQKKGIRFQRVLDMDRQHQGIDLIYHSKNNEYYIDEKAQLDYLNADLPTFTFEISYYKNANLKTGWLFDKNKITTHYFLVTAIYTNDENDLLKGFRSCKITSVNREKLLSELDLLGIDQDILTEYDRVFRKAKRTGKIPIKELDPRTEGALFLSPHLAERPMNLQLRLSFLEKIKAGKKIH